MLAGRFVDMAPLVLRAREFIADHRAVAAEHYAPADLAGFAAGIGLAARGRGRAEVILAADVAVELGHPETAAQAFVLATSRAELVRHGRVTIIGPDFASLAVGARRPYGQVMLVAAPELETLDPFNLENTMYLTNRLPGHMVRSVPGRLWVRISREGRARGLDLKMIGTALIAAYAADFPGLTAAEVILVTESNEVVEALAPLAAEAKILAGRHQKLALGADGEAECRDLDCDNCDEKPVCDNLRDVVIKKRMKAEG